MSKKISASSYRIERKLFIYSKIPLNYNKPQDGWSVVLGGHRLYEDGDRHFVDRVIPHPNYDNTIVTTGKQFSCYSFNSAPLY